VRKINYGYLRVLSEIGTKKWEWGGWGGIVIQIVVFFFTEGKLITSFIRGRIPLPVGKIYSGQVFF
jgi:hypothetical protein